VVISKDCQLTESGNTCQLLVRARPVSPPLVAIIFCGVFIVVTFSARMGIVLLAKSQRWYDTSMLTVVKAHRVTPAGEITTFPLTIRSMMPDSQVSITGLVTD
jgi:hypothetical protein